MKNCCFPYSLTSVDASSYNEKNHIGQDGSMEGFSESDQWPEGLCLSVFHHRQINLRDGTIGSIRLLKV
jgi:hypothetical protein